MHVCRQQTLSNQPSSRRVRSRVSTSLAFEQVVPRGRRDQNHLVWGSPKAKLANTSWKISKGLRSELMFDYMFVNLGLGKGPLKVLDY